MSFDLQAFNQEIGKRKAYIDSCLKQYLSSEDSYPPVIHQAMHYAVFNGGKRLRPIMLIEASQIAGGTAEKVMPAACAIELIHSYSLVHDDLPAMDDDDFRRGKPTCHRVFGEANAILTGDALLTSAFELMARNADVEGIDPKNVIRMIGEIAAAAGSQGMVGGQVIDLASEGQNIDYKTLQKLHSLKTGQLFKAALRAGAILNNMDEKALQVLSLYAEHFGLAFQISDDILDVQGDESLIGKPVGSDLKNNKTTYTSLFGVEGASQLLGQSIEICLSALENFGQEADFLRDLAQFILYRKS